jgi:hypothetical protein
VRRRIEDAFLPNLGGAGDGRSHEDQHRRNENDERRHLHFVSFDLLAQVLRRSSHHEPRYEDGDDGEHQHAVKARADPAEDDFAELHEPHRNQPAQRRE